MVGEDDRRRGVVAFVPDLDGVRLAREAIVRAAEIAVRERADSKLAGRAERLLDVDPATAWRETLTAREIALDEDAA